MGYELHIERADPLRISAREWDEWVERDPDFEPSRR